MRRKIIVNESIKTKLMRVDVLPITDSWLGNWFIRDGYYCTIVRLCGGQKSVTALRYWEVCCEKQAG